MSRVFPVLLGTFAGLRNLHAWPVLAGLGVGLGGGGLCAATWTDGPNALVRSNTSVAITWETDVPTGGRVHYGPAGTGLDRRANGDVGTNHVVPLTNLLAGTGYRYTVGTARQALATNSFRVPGKLA
jgi:hypothetical protein